MGPGQFGYGGGAILVRFAYSPPIDYDHKSIPFTVSMCFGKIRP